MAEHGRRDLLRILVEDDVAPGDDPDRDRVATGRRDPQDRGREECVVVADHDEGGDVEATVTVPAQHEAGNVVDDQL